MPRHEFGVIDDFDINKDYSEYEPDKYECISVDDKLIVDIVQYLKNIKTYHHCFDRKETGLAYYGVTIIPPRSLMFLYDIVTTSNQFKKSEELADLSALIITAKIKEKHLIHFGI